jgi:hypothetical protein
MRCTGHEVCMGEMRNAYKNLVRKPEGKKPLRRRRYRWESIIKMDRKELKCEDWTRYIYFR